MADGSDEGEPTEKAVTFDFARMWEEERLDLDYNSVPDLLKIAAGMYKRAFGEFDAGSVSFALTITGGFNTIGFVIAESINFETYKGEEAPDLDKVP